MNHAEEDSQKIRVKNKIILWTTFIIAGIFALIVGVGSAIIFIHGLKLYTP